jgi:hypothetical protein
MGRLTQCAAAATALQKAYKYAREKCRQEPDPITQVVLSNLVNATQAAYDNEQSLESPEALGEAGQHGVTLLSRGRPMEDEKISEKRTE